MFKDLAKKMPGKTVFAVSHGQFLNYLFSYLMSGTNDKGLMASTLVNPHNNGLTVIDFDTIEKPNYEGGQDMVTFVSARLIAHNMQVIENSHNTSPVDFTY